VDCEEVTASFGNRVNKRMWCSGCNKKGGYGGVPWESHAQKNNRAVDKPVSEGDADMDTEAESHSKRKHPANTTAPKNRAVDKPVSESDADTDTEAESHSKIKHPANATAAKCRAVDKPVSEGDADMDTPVVSMRHQTGVCPMGQFHEDTDVTPCQKEKWTNEENDQLVKLVSLHGETTEWSLLASHMAGSKQFLVFFRFFILGLLAAVVSFLTSSFLPFALFLLALPHHHPCCPDHPPSVFLPAYFPS
jgi:hypothetical protein